MTEMNRDTMFALLCEIRKVAMEASMMGAMKKGSGVLVDVYNRCLDALTEQGDTLVKTLFPTLDRNAANIDEVGAAAALLSSYVKPERASRHREPFRGPDDEDDED